MNGIGQKFLNELDAKLWKVAHKLRSSVESGEYNDVVLRLTFIKCAGDAFYVSKDELKLLFSRQGSDYFLVSDEPDEINAEMGRCPCKIQLLVRSILRRYKYPADAIGQVLKQTEKLCGDRMVII